MFLIKKANESDFVVNIVDGNIVLFNSEALITTINSGGLWFGGVDGAICSVAGKLFHQKAGNLIGSLHDKMTIFAQGNGSTKFKNVIFVIDNLISPISEIIKVALDEAEFQGLNEVSIPTIRLGVMKGVVEKNEIDWLNGFNDGILNFLKSRKTENLKKLSLVVYDDFNFVDNAKSYFSLISK